MSSKISKTERYVVNKQGKKLYTVTYTPDINQPIARLFFVHGLGEHCGRYDKVFSRMAQAGIAVHGFDFHNHGKSESLEPSQRAYINSFQLLLDDVSDVVDAVLDGLQDQQQVPRVPMFLAGHSMGGLVATHAAIRSQDMWSGLIGHSGCFDVEWTMLVRVQSYVGRLLSWLAPAARVVTAVRPEDMNKDPAIVEAFLKDPLIVRGNVCARTACVLVDAFYELGHKARDLTIPVYVAHGTMDKCCSLPAARRFIKSVSSKDATMYEFEGGYHEPLQGPEWSDATDRMVKWMTERAGKK